MRIFLSATNPDNWHLVEQIQIHVLFDEATTEKFYISLIENPIYCTVLQNDENQNIMEFPKVQRRKRFFYNFIQP